MSAHRYRFLTPEACIVVSTGGYFDVFASASRPAHQRPAYRGEATELGRAVSNGERLLISPRSPAMTEAVAAWSSGHGADALAGRLGQGRQDVPAAAPANAEKA